MADESLLGGAGPMIGVQALSSLAQLYQSEQNRKANQATLDKIQAAFDAIKPPGYNVTPLTPPALITQQVPEPAFDFSKMTPEQYKVVGQYAPQLAPKIQEQNPTLVQRSAQGQQGMQAQMAALQKYKDIANQGSNPELEQQLSQAGQQAAQQANAQRSSVLQEANRRGQLGAGTALAAQLQGGASAMGNLANQSQNAATQAYQQRLQALAQSASLGGQVANQDMNQQGMNANIINQFNQRTSQQGQQYANQNANQQNQAQMYNMGQQQDAANKNVGMTNQYAQAAQNRNDALQQALYGMRTGERGFQNQTAQQQYGANAAEIARQNQLQSQGFQNQMQQFGAQSGLGQMQMGVGNQNTAARNQAIQGLGEGAIAGMMYGQNQENSEANRQNALQSSYYKKTGKFMTDDQLQNPSSMNGG